MFSDSPEMGTVLHVSWISVYVNVTKAVLNWMDRLSSYYWGDKVWSQFVLLCVWCAGGRACPWTSWVCPATSPSHSQRRISALVSGRHKINQCLFLQIYTSTCFQLVKDTVVSLIIFCEIFANFLLFCTIFTYITILLFNTRIPTVSVADLDPGSGAFLTPGSGVRDPE